MFFAVWRAIGADEKIEGEVVDPTRQQKPGIGEELGDVAEAAEPALLPIQKMRISMV